MFSEVILFGFVGVFYSIILIIFFQNEFKLLLTNKEFVIVIGLNGAFSYLYGQLLTSGLVNLNTSTISTFSGALPNMFSNVSLLIILLSKAFFAGWLTKIILNKLSTHNDNWLQDLRKLKYWLPAASFIQAIEIVGLTLIPSLLFLIVSVKLSMLGQIVLTIILSAFTFPLYLILLAHKYPLTRSLLKSFLIVLTSSRKWLHIFLFALFISGGLVYIWIPDTLAEIVFGVPRELSNWAVNIQLLSGYSFKSYWFNEYSNSLNFGSSTIISILLFLSNSIILTVLKIKVADILIKSGYLKQTV